MGKGVWEFYIMNAVKVDSAKRIRLTVLTPGDYYEERGSPIAWFTPETGARP